MYDLIGDVHGHADELVELLQALGYQLSNGAYRYRGSVHPERKVIFLGDFIDRGPKIRQVLEIVRPMVEAGTALAVMGNHELNALAFHTKDPQHSGSFLRPRDNKNIRQHAQTMLQLKDQELKDALDWFRTLPFWLDLDGLRVVHACWDDQAMQRMSQDRPGGSRVTDEFLESASRHEHSLFEAVEIVLKGKEIKLPAGVSFIDKDGHVRDQTRVRWFESPENKTYQSYALTDKISSDQPLDAALVKNAIPYPATAKPVFVGHYWLSAECPEILAPNVACVDYSVAKGGFLCAYRWQGERTLTNDKFTWAKKAKG